MARYAYDVNTTQRYIDVHKQFQGGLKTVDTDDSLGAVFLRDAENVSLSEFGFIEKRYGTYKNFLATLENKTITINSKLQGYWEFLNKYIVIAVDGNIYWQNIETPDSTFNLFDQYLFPLIDDSDSNVPDFRTIFNWGDGGSTSDLSQSFRRFFGVSFQNQKEFGGVILSNVLYIFTGTYPIYIAETTTNSGTVSLQAFLFTQDTPTYEEIVVAGHNLMEDNYEDLYFTEDFKNSEIINLIAGIEIAPFEFQNGKKIYPTLENPTNDVLNVKTFGYRPLYSNAIDDILKFRFNYTLADDLLRPFEPNINPPQNFFNTTTLKSISYRNSGPGASDLSFKPLLTDSYSSVGLDNIEGNLQELNFVIPDFYEGTVTPANVTTTTSALPSESSTTYAITPNFWQGHYESSEGYYGLFLNQKEEETGDFYGIRIDKKVIAPIIEVPVEFLYNISTQQINESNKNFALAVKSDDSGLNVPLEVSRDYVQTFVSNLFNTQNRTLVGDANYIYDFYVKKISPQAALPATGLIFRRRRAFYGGTTVTFVTESEIPVYMYEHSTLDSNVVVTWNQSNDLLYVTVTENGNQVVSNLNVTYLAEDGARYPLKVSYLRFAYPQGAVEQELRDNILNSAPTKVTLIPFKNDNTELVGFSKTYTLNVDSNFKFLADSNSYLFTLPDDLTFPTETHTVKIKLDVTTFNFPTTQAIGPYETDYKNITRFTVRDQFNFVSSSLNGDILQYIVQTSGSSDKDYYFFSDFEALPVLDLINISQIDTVIDPIFYMGGWVNAITELQAGSYGVNLLEANIFKGLLSGLYDFKFEFETKQRYYEPDLGIATTFKTSIHNFIAKNIRIIEQEFDGLPGSLNSNIRLHPIWSCNRVIEHYNKLMVWGSTEMPNSVFYSFPDRPFYFPSYFYLDFKNDNDLPVLSVVPFMNVLVVQNEDQTWGIKGNSGIIDAPAPYFVFTINPTIGTIAPKSVRPVRNQLFFLSKLGVVSLRSLFAADDQYNIDFADLNIRNIVPQDPDAIGIQFDNQYWLNFPNYGITLRWYIDKKAWVKDVYGSHFDSRNVRVLKNIDADGNQLFGWHGFNGVFKYQIKNGKLEFITHPSSIKSTDIGIYKIGVDYALPTDIGSVVPTKFETSFLNQNYPFHPKNYKEAKFDFTLQNEYNKGVSKVYEADDLELTSSHTISYTDLDTTPKAFIPNHRYEITYDTSIYTTNLLDGNYTLDTIILDGNYVGQSTDIVDGVYGVTIDTISYNGQNIDIITEDLDTATFILPHNIDPEGSLVITGNFASSQGDAILSDITYDSNLTFRTWVISENQTLNMDNLESYDASLAEMNINLGTKLGQQWVFGTSDFGNKITAVNTIKLSGKGYNSKVYMEDFSKSKWTLESMGLTYKMKRARSR